MSWATVVTSYRTVLANGSLRRCLFAFLLFNAAEYGVWIAITLYAYARGGARAAGLVMIMQLVPATVVAPLAAAVGERLPRDRALAAGYAVQAVAHVVCGLALLTMPEPVAYAAAVVAAATITFTRPVHYALLPRLARTPEQLTAANSVSSTAEGVGVMLGPLLASTIIAAVRPGGVFVTFGALLLVATAITIRLRLGDHEPEAMHVGDPEHHRVADALRSIADLRHDAPAAVLALFGGSQFVLLGLLDVFYAVLAVDVLDIGEEGAGVLAATVGLGTIVGAGGTALLVGRRRLTAPLLLATLTMGLAIACVAIPRSLAPVLAAFVAVGAARSFFDVATRTLLQRSVDDDVVARVFGMQEALLMGGYAAGAAAAPVLIAVFGTRGAFMAAGTLLPISGLLAFRPLRTLDARAVVPPLERLEILTRLPVFAPVPQPVLERLARQLVSVAVRSGKAVIEEGDPGDAFYIIASGEAQVTSGGRDLARLSPGDHFGEIALMRDVPRTATVTAATDLELLALERDEFLAAVTGTPRSEELIRREVERRMGGIRRRSPRVRKRQR